MPSKEHYVFIATIERVIDGDTFDVVVDLGFRITTYQRFRLAHVDTPDIRGKERPEGLPVKEYVKDLIEGKTLLIETFKRGKYGRYVAEIFLEDGSKLSEHLLENGMAERVDY